MSGRDQLRQQIAEAIWRADINTGHRDFIAEFDVSWGLGKCVIEVGDDVVRKCTHPEVVNG